MERWGVAEGIYIRFIHQSVNDDTSLFSFAQLSSLYVFIRSLSSLHCRLLLVFSVAFIIRRLESVLVDRCAPPSKTQDRRSEEAGFLRPRSFGKPCCQKPLQTVVPLPLLLRCFRRILIWFILGFVILLVLRHT